MPYKRLKILKGYLDRLLAPQLRLLHRFGVKPIHLTALSLPCGLAGVWLLYEKPVFSSLLILAYLALDVLDGTMARVTGYVSQFGAKLDFMIDRIIASFFLIVYYLNSGDLLIPAVGLTAIVAFSLEDLGLIKR